MVSGNNALQNVAAIKMHITQASALGASYIVFPENCVLMQSSGLYDLAQHILKTPAFLEEFSVLAAKHSIAITLGSVPMFTAEKGEEGRVRAAALTWNSSGKLICRYDKIHLFDAKITDAHGCYRESSYIAPGRELALAQVGEFSIGMSICYDLRFSAMFDQLRVRGAHIFIVPAAFTQVTGAAHWIPLLRARAIENQCYVLGVNQGGQHDPTRETFGHTLAIDPWGEVIESLEKGAGLLVVDLSLSKLEAIRDSMPVYEHRRLN